MSSAYLTQLSVTGNTMEHYKIRFETYKDVSMPYCIYEHYLGDWETQYGLENTKDQVRSYSYKTIPRFVENDKTYEMTTYCYTTYNYKVTARIYFDYTEILTIYVKVDVETLTKPSNNIIVELTKSIEYGDLMDCLANARDDTIRKNTSSNKEYLENLRKECAIEYAADH